MNKYYIIAVPDSAEADMYQSDTRKVYEVEAASVEEAIRKELEDYQILNWDYTIVQEEDAYHSDALKSGGRFDDIEPQ